MFRFGPPGALHLFVNRNEYSTVARTQVRGEASLIRLRQGLTWMPALLGLLIICGESTRVMGADHTMMWLSRLCSPLMKIPTVQMVTLNHVLRKCGHLFGYGTLGLVLMRAWFALLQARIHRMRSRVRLRAETLALLSVAVIASLDELHQSFLPNRTACFSDVLLDTGGALLLISLSSVTVALRRKRILTRLVRVRNGQQWRPEAWPAHNGLLLGQSR